MKTDALTHTDHLGERRYLMNHFIPSIDNEPDSLSALVVWHDKYESVNQPIEVKFIINIDGCLYILILIVVIGFVGLIIGTV